VVVGIIVWHSLVNLLTDDHTESLVPHRLSVDSVLSLE
jgi:hypothetical protein